jgi:hypothetical protein
VVRETHTFPIGAIHPPPAEGGCLVVLRAIRGAAMEEMRSHESQRDFGSEDEIVIKEFYDHKNNPWSKEVATRSPSVYVMFMNDWTVIHCESGNELRRIYLENPDKFISEPLYLAIPRYLKSKIDEYDDNY